jgi:hypothetical protein
VNQLTSQTILTGHYCFEMTSGLTHRWRVYYDSWATGARLLSLQCICYGLTMATLSFLGHNRILFAWVVIGCTTAGSRSVQMYVTSNILAASPHRVHAALIPAPPPIPSGDDDDTIGNLKGDPENGELGRWAQFKMDRLWDWNAVAREVGWKLGVLMLFTTAWLFWGIEQGRY